MHRFKSPQRQNGIATILIVLLLGLAVSVTVAATVYGLRSNQQQQVTTHAVSAAQAAAWRGVETVRQYLLKADQEAFKKWAAHQDQLPLPIHGLDGINIPDGNAFMTRITSLDSGTHYQLTCRITGFSAAADVSNKTSATVEVVYDVNTGTSTVPGKSTCTNVPSVPVIFNGNLNITGGSLGVTNTTSYENIAVIGDINLTNASQASISGCATGNIFLNGGGIKENGHLFSGGKITVNSMTPPNGTTLWGKEIELDSSASGAKYKALQAGGYTADVLDQRNLLIGHATVGGTIIPSTVTSNGLPWSAGTLIPFANPIVITLTDGSTFLVDLSIASINPNSGEVTNLQKAATPLISPNGTATLPTNLHFVATAIAGGNISFASLGQTDLVWGNTIQASLGLQGFQITSLYANGELQAGRGSIQKFLGGADLWAKPAQGSTQIKNYSNFPTIASGSLAGSVFYNSARSAFPNSDLSAVGLQIQTPQSVSPGLPGAPYCESRVQAFQADTLKSSANYVFELIDNVPYLTIKNVKTAGDLSLDGKYNLKTTDISMLPAAGGKAFIACTQQPDQWGNGRCRQLKDTTATTGWQFTDIYRFPPGVAWFDRSVTINGAQPKLLNTILSAGDVVFTTRGTTRTVMAPNFSTPADVCDGDFWPTNLCDKSSKPSRFSTWKDETGAIHTGQAIANLAVAAEGDGDLAGWTFYGHMLLNKALRTSASKAIIYGSLTVGAGAPGSTTAITAGGAEVRLPNSADNFFRPGMCAPLNPSPIPSNQAFVTWSHYL